MKKVISNLLRGVISFGLLAGLIYFIGPANILRNFQHTRLDYLAAAVLIFLGALLLFALRWQVLLQHSGDSPGYRRLVVFYFIGYFFNNFLPTAIGGDVSRAYYAARANGNRAGSIGSVIFERILGFLSILTLALVSMIWAFDYWDDLLVSLTLGLLLLVLFSLVSLLNPALFAFFSRLMAKITVLGIGKKIIEVLESIHTYRESRKTVFYGFLISVACQLMLIVMNLFLARALGLSAVKLEHLFLVIPATFVIGLLPSLNGLGVRESGYVIFLSEILHVTTPDQALSLSLMNTFVPMAMSMVGGVLLFFYRHRPTEVPPRASGGSVSGS